MLVFCINNSAMALAPSALISFPRRSKEVIVSFFLMAFTMYTIPKLIGFFSKVLYLHPLKNNLLNQYLRTSYLLKLQLQQHMLPLKVNE